MSKNLFMVSLFVLSSIGSKSFFQISISTSFLTNQTATALTSTWPSQNEIENVSIEDSLQLENLSLNSAKTSFFYHHNLNTGVSTLSSISYNTTSSMSINEKIPNYSTYYDIPVSNVKSSASANDNMVAIDTNHYTNYQPSAVAYFDGLETYDSSLYLRGTAFLIGDGLAITAAHCVYQDNQFIKKEKLAFESLNYNKIFMDSANVTDVYIPKEFYDDGNSYYSVDSSGNRNYMLHQTAQNYDWAILKLNKSNLHNTYGGFSIRTKYTLANEYSMAIGYPANENTALYSSCGKNNASYTDYRYLLYQYNYPGMSGGPIICYYYYQLTMEDESFVVGIVSTKEEKNLCSYTGGTRITNEMVTLISQID